METATSVDELWAKNKDDTRVHFAGLGVGFADEAYAMVDAIDWPEGFCRRDIGWRALT